MKLARPSLPGSWEQQRRADGTLLIQVLRGTRGCAPAFGWTLLCLLGLVVYLCSGMYLVLGWGGWVVGGGLWLYRLGWLLMESEAWHLSPGRMELRTSLFGLRGRRDAWRDARILVKGPVDLNAEVCLLAVPEGRRYFRTPEEVQLHQTGSLEEALALAALLSESTGWPIEYTQLDLAVDRTLQYTLRTTSLDRLRLLIETRPLLPRLVQELHTPRRNLLLGMMRESEAEHPAIEPALQDPHPAFRAAAIDLLAALEDGRALPALRGVLTGGDTVVQPLAADALGYLRDPEAVPALCEALRQRDPLPAAAARALGLIADPQSVPALCAMLNPGTQAPQPVARWEAAMALGRIQDRLAVPALRQALLDAVPQVREGAAYALGQIGDPAAAPDLCRCLYDPASPVAQRAAAALGMIRDEGAVPVLCDVMATGVAATRLEVAGALAKIGSDPAIQTLCGALADPNSAVRRAAAVGIGAVVGQREVLPLQLRAAIPALKRMSSPLSIEPSEVKRACRETLDRIEFRTGALKRLPLPAEAAVPSPDNLPRVSEIAE